MTARITLCALLVLLISICSTPVSGQYYPQQPGQQSTQTAGPPRPDYSSPQPPAQGAASPQGAYQGAPGQPMPPGGAAIVPQNTPTLQRRAPQAANAAFPPLAPDEQAEVDAVLQKWEEASKTHKRIAIEFNRFEFKPAFAPTNNPNAPLHIDRGNADFSSTGKWMWSIRGEWVNNKVVEGQRTELMVFDGKSIYEFNYPDKSVTQHILSDDMKGEEMIRAMLPFLFGTDMNKLKQRYFIRVLKLADEKTVCLEAWPRFQDEASNFRVARMIIDLSKMEPTGLKLTMPDGSNSYSYEFTKVDINPRSPIDLFNDPFKVKIPSGWSTHVEQMRAAEVTNRPPASVTR